MDKIFAVIAASIPLFLILIFLLRVLYTRLQMRTLELMLVLTTSTLPAGYFLPRRRAFSAALEGGLAVAIFFSFTCALLIIAGGLWGLSCAKRLNETRTWHRLWLIVVGWGFLCSIPSGLAIPILIGHLTRNWPVLLICGALLPFAFVGARIEQRCQETQADK